MQLIITVAAIHLMACLSPGPDIFLVVLNSLRHGWRAGVATTTGILSGVLLHIIFGITGLSYLLTRNADLHTALALAGGAWLMFLGIRGIRHNPKDRPGNAVQVDKKTLPKGFLDSWTQGFLANLLNPKALLYLLSLFSVMLGPDVPLRIRIASGAAMLAVQACAFSSVALLTDRPHFKDKWIRLQTWLDRGISIVLLALGLWIWVLKLLSLAG